MLKRIWAIFKRDIKVNLRDTLSLYIIIAPLLLAVGINLISPSINDTTVNLALVEGASNQQAEYLDQFAHIETLKDEEDVERRVEGRDNIIGILPKEDGYYLLKQGNEPDYVVEYAKLLNVLYESGVTLDDAETKIETFGQKVPPLKKMLVNMLLMMIPMLAGMLIALNIVEEKSDKTVRAVLVSPTSRTAFILGKSMTGMIISLVLSVICIIITGFYAVNIGLLVLVALATTILALMIGFIQGISSDDVMEAAGSVKLMFLPMAGSIVGYELVTGNWQIFFYWSPFYWAYRANDIILSKNGTWLQLLLYVGIILVICGVSYALLAPRIRKGLH